MQVGFSVIDRDGRLQLQLHGCRASDRRALVTVARQAHVSAVLMGRLYYRHEPSSSSSRAGPAGDAELALAAYRQWGAGGIERLEGDFCLVIVDVEQLLLLAARDPLGGFPLFWAQHAGRLTVSTGMATPLALLPTRRLDMEYVAEYLARPVLAIREMPSEACVYQGIRRVVPGSVLRLRLADGSSERHTYWHWPDRLVDPGAVGMEDIAGQFEDRFRQAVGERVRGSTAAHVSGGMDSTSVALVARDWLDAGTGPPPLHALSIVYGGALAQEIPYIESALDGQHGIVAHRIPGDDMPPYERFADPPQHDEPHPGLLDLAKERATIETASHVGAETILTGYGGDDLLDISRHDITELLRAGRVRAGWHLARRYARLHNTDPWRVFHDFGLANVLPVGLRGGWRSWLHRGRVGWRHQGDGTIAPWIRPAFARSAQLYERGLRNLRWMYGACRPVHLSLGLAAIQTYVGDWSRWYLAAPRGIMIAHPFADPRLLSFGLGVRLRFRQEPGQQKPILAYAMRDVLPDKIRNRRGKAHFDAAYYRGLARHLPVLERLVQEAPIDDLGVFDKATLTDCLRQAALGVDLPDGTMRLDLTLSLITWLSMQDQRRRQAELPTETITLRRTESPSEAQATP